MAINFVGIKPFSYQRDVIEEVKRGKGTGRVVVVKSRRQVGKSTLISNLLLYFAINYNNTRNYCLSPTLKQGKNIYRSIVNATVKSGIIKTRNATELTITLINGSIINFKSAEQKDSLRGETVSGILCIDECAYISDEVYNIIRPWTDFHKAVTLMVSTPLIKSGFFFQYYNYGLNGENNTVSIDWADEKYREDMEIILPPEKLEEYKRILPRNVFLTEYMAQFLDGEGSVFTDFSDCLKFNKIKPTDKLYCGLDWANGYEGDDTVLSIFNQYGNMVYLSYFNKLSTLKQIEHIYNRLEPYLNQIVVIASESNSIGTPFTDMLKNKSQILARVIKEFTTTNASKNAIVQKMQVALEQKNITLLPDEKLKQEFGFFTAEYNPKTRNVSYNAPQGLHDDIVMATLLAYDAYTINNQTGKYYIR